MNLLDHALAYAARRWSIIPVAGKKPIGIRGWKRYQEERPSGATLRRWFGDNGVTGLAVICGKVSGYLVVRDFDTADSHRRWAERFPELAEILPTVQTARGFHVYFTGNLDRIVTVRGGEVHEGELRGGGYVLLPPSKHPSGLTYRWTVQLLGVDYSTANKWLRGLTADKVLEVAERGSMKSGRRRASRFFYVAG